VDGNPPVLFEKMTGAYETASRSGFFGNGIVMFEIAEPPLPPPEEGFTITGIPAESHRVYALSVNPMNIQEAGIVSIRGFGLITVQEPEPPAEPEAEPEIPASGIVKWAVPPPDGAYTLLVLVETTFYKAPNVDINAVEGIEWDSFTELYPDLTGTVSVIGTPQVGAPLTADTNNLNGSGTVAYQWRRGNSPSVEGTPIPGAESAEYTPAVEDEDMYLSLTVTREGTVGSVSAESVGPVLPEPTVTGVTISPETASVPRGGSETFTAGVEGTGSPEQTVIWSVADPEEPGTGISGGTLTIDPEETAETLTVRAASVVDPAQYAEAVVAVTDGT
jgi:hypothetical protein